MSSLFANIEKQVSGKGENFHLKGEFDFPIGEITCIYGPSGAGKTTLLRVLAGLSLVDKGLISFGDTLWFSKEKKINISIQKREVGFVFQDYGLFPNLSARENIFFGASPGNSKWIQQFCEEMEINSLLSRFPNQLSGGQQQRVAIARAIARRPALLLMDEPLSALDVNLRIRIQDLLIRFQAESKTTMIFVSHDIPEIFRMARHVIRLDEGKIIQFGKPEEVLQIEKNQLRQILST